MVDAVPGQPQFLLQQTISEQRKNEYPHLREQPANLPVKEEQGKSDDEDSIKKREHAIGKEDELKPPVVFRYLNRRAKDVLADEQTHILSRVVTEFRNFEVVHQREISVEPDEGIHVDEDRGKSRRNHKSERQVMREISRGRKVPDETRDRANNQLDKGARERDPQFGGLALEGPRVGYVGVERRHEVDQHEPDL